MKMGPIISWGKCILSNLNVYDMGNNTVMLERAYHRQFLINVEIIKAVSKFAGLCLEMENIFFPSLKRFGKINQERRRGEDIPDPKIILDRSLSRRFPRSGWLVVKNSFFFGE